MSSNPTKTALPSAEFDKDGKPYLDDMEMQKMETKTMSQKASDYVASVTRKVVGDLTGEDLTKVIWLSGTLFFIVGGYWLLRSLKDPIMSAINGVEYIPQAKIASLFVVFGLVLVYNKLLDKFRLDELFMYMGLFYGCLFGIMGLLLLHPTIGLQNTVASPSRFLGWLSYCSIESFGSMVVQCFWALVNSSVDEKFAKRNFGFIIAGAQIGSIFGPTLATQAEYVGIPLLYMSGALVMFMMVTAMWFYMKKFPPALEDKKTGGGKGVKKSEEGMMEGISLMYEHNFVKGIFCISSFFMVQVTVVDYMMKVLAKTKYSAMYPDDPQMALKAFASFMGYFGQFTNGISFMFSLFGTGFVIEKFGLTATLIMFPALLLICTVVVWVWPTIWVVFTVMMVMKGMSYALNNPTKEILYQVTSKNIKSKCKSWIDTFGQRSAKATGSIITNAFATNIVLLTNYGSGVGVIMSVFLIWCSDYMGNEYARLQKNNEKVGEAAEAPQGSHMELTKLQHSQEDNTCGLAEEGQEISGGLASK